MYNILRQRPVTTISYNECKIVDAEGETIEFDIYSPIVKKYSSLIIFYHGVNQNGNKDHRIQAVCKQLSALGFTVIAPKLNNISQLCIKEDAFFEVYRVTRLIKENYSGQFNKVGLFTVCYTTSTVIYSLAQNDLQNFAHCMITVGGCFNPINLFRNMLSNKIEDPYSRIIALLNFYPSLAELSPQISIGLQCLIEDAQEGNNFSKFNSFLTSEALSFENKKELEQLVDKINNSIPLFSDDEYSFQNPDYKFNICLDISGFKVPCILIHGENDKVFYPHETINFKNTLDKNKIKNYLILTRLLEHADIQFKLSYAYDLLKLIKGISIFFSKLL